jgi:hypothetical protein
MDIEKLAAATILTLAVVFVLWRIVEKWSPSAAVVKVEKRLEDYADDELLKLVDDIMTRLADNSGHAQAIASAQAATARQADILAKVKAKVAAATLAS